MGTKLNKDAYKKLIKEDMEAVEKYFSKHSLEKMHIQEILRSSIECYYPSVGKDLASTESKCNKQSVSNNEMAVCTCKHDPPVRKVEDGTEICCECEFPVQTDC